MTAKLYVVATPLGNLHDLSPRAKKTLQDVSWIATEDTRHTQALLSHFGLSNRCIALHAFNEKKQREHLIEALQRGESGALVSDAGTPVISDPGFHVIQAAHEAGVEVVAVPGPCAAIAALSVLAIQEGPFHFEGFLPPKSSHRCKRLDVLKSFSQSLVFYEAPHRIKHLLDDLTQVLGADRMAGIAREMTKKFESVYRGSLSTLKEAIDTAKIPEKGEFVVVVAGQTDQKPWSADEEALIKTLLDYLPVNKAAKLATQLTALDRQTCYQMAVNIQNNSR